MSKILIVDHNRDYRELVIFLLRFAGHVVYSASTAEECIEMAKQYRPELFLIELASPDINAINLCLKLGEDISTASVPVIFLVDPDKINQLDQLPENYGKSYLLKSLSPDQLTRKVEQILHSHSKHFAGPGS